MCGCAGSRGSCSHDPAAPTPDNGLGGCGECEPHSDATPTPNAAPDVVMSDACSSSVEMSPEAALQGLVGALRARHDPPPGQRAVTTNGWKAVDELELIKKHDSPVGSVCWALRPPRRERSPACRHFFFWQNAGSVLNVWGGCLCAGLVFLFFKLDALSRRRRHI